MTAATAVRERPILMSGSMVRAILYGSKSQTRRVVKGQVPAWANDAYRAHCLDTIRCPFGQPGDRLWVRETFFDHGGDLATMALDERVEYRAEPWDRLCEDHEAGIWIPSIFMPRWASRLSLDVTSIRVERLQAISEADAEAEGIGPQGYMNYFSGLANGRCFNRARDAYRELWDSLNAKRGYGWDANPFVWVVEFQKVAS